MGFGESGMYAQRGHGSSTPLPRYLALYVSSIGLFLSYIIAFYDKLVI